MFSCVTPKMVQHIAIHENCNQKIPCTHLCDITLQDGRMQSKNFYIYEIHALLQEIAKKKITASPSHFTEFLQFENYITFTEYDSIDASEERINPSYPFILWSPKNFINPQPTELLTSLFRDSLR